LFAEYSNDWLRHLKRNYIILAAVLLIALISISLFLTVNMLSKQTSTTTRTTNRQFYVGVEFAYADQFGELKALVDKVKDYTNLFVIGSVGISFNRTALDESADYINQSGLSFIVLFTSYPMYNNTGGWSNNYSIFDWMKDAQQKYGNKFLGIYRFDEPGGNQLDGGQFQLIDKTNTAGGYAEVAQSYVGNLSSILKYYRDKGGSPQIFTSDYGLYWFDYASSYNTVFAEFVGKQSRFVGNQSKQQIIALDRGAAESFNKDWGIIVTWKYNQPPYLESGDELYSDLAQAYCTGAKYAVVFSYPNITASAYGTLTDAHFAALQKFWYDIHNNTAAFVPSKAEVAYVIPKDFGFGFRSTSDTIWGLFPADNFTYTQKIWDDTNLLLAKYYNNLNIIYDDPQVIGSTLNQYTKVYYWNQTIT
jgi:hypothetical protein